jgi:hypothetical protein
MSVAQSLDTPFERLAILPTTMNWRGGWSVSQQYFKNDVVVSPLNFATYILTPTSIIGGVDPSLSVGEWIELSSPNTAVNSVRAGVGISVAGTTNPVITNAGVLTVTPGIGIVNTGTASDVILENSGAVTLQQGSGISITGTSQLPTITNTGVRQIQQGNGILIDNTNPNIPSISNNGVLTVNQGSGITVNNTDPRNPIVSASVGFTSIIVGTVGNQNIPFMAPSTCSVAGQASFFVLTNGLFASYLLNGPPSPNGVFLINFTGYNLFFTNNGGSPTVGQNLVSIGFFDSALNATYTAGQTVGLATGAVYPINATMPLCVFNVTAARTAGLRNLDQIVLTNNTASPFVCPSANAITAVYYPNGLE